MPPLLRRLREYNDRYALILLLWTAFLVRGGKTPEEFFVLGTGVLLCAGISLWTNPDRFPFRRCGLEVAVFLCLCLSQRMSLDPSASLFRTAQLMTFLVLWTSLKANPALLRNEESIYVHIALSGLVSLVLTMKQVAGGVWMFSSGFFPINPIFNYAWLACVGLALVARSIERQRRGEPFRRLEGLVGPACVLASLMGPARSVIPALALGTIYVIRPWLTARRIAIALIASLAAFSFTPNRLLARRLRLNEGNYRSKIWSVAVAAARDRPIAGWGSGNFEMAYQRHAFPVETDAVRFGRTTEFSHNEYLQAACDAGLIVFSILIWACGSILSASAADRPATQIPAKTALIVLLAVAVSNITWHMPILLYVTLLWAGLLFRERWEREPGGRPVSSGAARIGGLVILTFVGAALGWSAVRDRWAAQRQWRRIVRVDPRDAAAWEGWADEQTEMKQALFGYLRAAELVPDQVYYRERLAETLAKSSNPEFLPHAMGEYEAVLRLAPSRAIDVLALGRLHFRKGEFKSALDEFRQARRIEPHYWEADLWIARALAGMGKRSKAAWTLRYLTTRRESYLAWRGEVGADLPSSGGGAYDRVILAYDGAAVQRDLQRILASRGD